MLEKSLWAKSQCPGSYFISKQAMGFLSAHPITIIPPIKKGGKNRPFIYSFLLPAPGIRLY
jgi:hypothetical protein